MQNRHPNPQDPEAGYLLVAVIVACALVLIALAVAAPVVARDLRRDKEVESQYRAEQYTRAIRLYYRKNKSYPPSMEALEKSNNIRFLRQKYVDPLTGKNDWRIIPVGGNQTTVKGFFGKPLAGIASAGLGSAAGLQSTTGGSTAGTAGTAPTTVTGSGLSAGFAGATIGGTAATPGTTGTTPAPGTPDTSSGSLDSLNGGGGPIMGVGTSRTGDSVTEPNEQSTYETWEFLYDPRIETLYALSKLTGGGGFGVAGAGTDTGTNITGTGNNINSDPNNPNNPTTTPPAGGTSPTQGPGSQLPSKVPNGQ